MKIEAGIAAGVVILGALWYAKSKLPELGTAAAGALNAINPLNRDNVIYGGVNAAAGAIAGNPDFSLGAWLYEKTHPAAMAAERAIVGDAPATVAPTRPPVMWTVADQDDADIGLAMARADYELDVVRASSGAAFGLYPGR